MPQDTVGIVRGLLPITDRMITHVSTVSLGKNAKKCGSGAEETRVAPDA
jgi:hypothetical protein